MTRSTEWFVAGTAGAVLAVFLGLAGAGGAEYTGWGPEETVYGPSSDFPSFARYLEDALGDGWAFFTAPSMGQESAFVRHRGPGGQWDAPVLLEMNDTAAVNCAIAVSGPDGSMVATFIIDGVIDDVLGANRYTPGLGWSGMETVAAATNASIRACPSPYAYAAGGAIVAWRQAEGSITSSWASVFVNGSGWQSPTLLEPDDTGSTSAQGLRGDAGGNVTIAWTQQVGAFRGVYARTHSPAAGWGPLTPLQPNMTYNATLGTLAVGPGGTTVVVWVQAGPQPLMARSHTPSGGWAAAAPVATGGRVPLLSGVVADPSGNFSVFWSHDPGGAAQAWANHYAPGAGWSAPHRLDTTGGVDSVSFQAVGDAQGDVTFVWNQSDGSTSSIWTARYDAGGVWTGASRLHAATASNNAEHLIALDGDGNVVVAWRRFEGTNSSVWAAWYMVGRGWQPERPVHNDSSWPVISFSVASYISPAGGASVIFTVSIGPQYAFVLSAGERPRFDPPLLDLASPSEGYRTSVALVLVEGTTEPGMVVTVNGQAVPVSGGRFPTAYRCPLAVTRWW